MMEHDMPDPNPVWWKREIIVATNQFEKDAVTHAQRVMRCPETGQMDEATITHLRGLQSLYGLRTTGTLDRATAVQIERMRNFYAV